VLLNAVIAEIIRLGRHDRAFLETRASGFEAFAAALPTDMAAAAQTTGVERHEIESLARHLSEPGKRVCILYDVDASFEKSPRDLQAIANLLTVTGNVGRPGCGLVLARHHSNGQGLVDLGAFPEGRARRCDRWPQSAGGAHAAGVAGGAGRRPRQGLFIFGENPALDERVRRAARVYRRRRGDGTCSTPETKPPPQRRAARFRIRGICGKRHLARSAGQAFVPAFRRLRG